MLRVLFVFISALLIACSKDRPAPVAPAGKAQAALEAPAAPTNLRFDAPTDSSCTVRWDASDGATDYDINYRPAVGGRWTNWPHRGASRQHSTIYGLEPNTEYRWAVRAENTDGPSAWIHGANFTTRPSSQEEGSDDAIASPTNLRFDAPTDSSCTVRWDAVDGATDYDVNYKPAQGGRWTNAPHRGVGLYNTIYDLELGTEYRWAVRAENTDGASEWVFGPNFTTLSEDQADGQGERADANSTASDEPITITADNSIDAELFQEASHEIQSSLEHLMPIVFSYHVLNGNEKTVEGVRGEVRLAKAYIVFSDYSITGEFTIAGTMWTGQPWGSGSNPNSPATGRVWVKEVDSDRRPFLIATKHELELGREGRQFKSIRSGLYVEAGAKYLATIKDDLIGAFKLALHTSLTKPNTYIDGIIPEGWSTGSGAFIYIEVERQRANWYFEFYCPAPAPKACASYALTDIKIKSNPVRIKGSLYVSRVQSKEEVKEDLRKGVGFGGYGVVYLDIGVDVAISDDKVEGTLTALNEAGRNTESDRSYTWTLEELTGEIQSYEYEIK